MKNKIFTLLVLSLLIYTNSGAQTTIKRQGVAGGSLNDGLRCVYLTKDGGFIVGGESESDVSGDKTGFNRGDWDYWIVKYNRAGQIQWDKTIGGEGTDILFSLQQTSDGGYILGGISDSWISYEKTEKIRGGDDYWVVKLDSVGNIQWDKTIGGLDQDYLYEIKQTADGGYILGGTSYSDKSGDKTGRRRGASDYWIVKLNSSGNIQWDKTVGGGHLIFLNLLISPGMEEVFYVDIPVQINPVLKPKTIKVGWIIGL